MRKRTLAVISFLVSVAIVYGLTFFARSLGIRVPLPGLISYLVAALILSPLLLALFTRLNRPILDWRKGRGRDIEAEEEHEEADIISLKLK